MKHLVVKAELPPDKEHVEVRLLSTTHIGDEFSDTKLSCWYGTQVHSFIYKNHAISMYGCETSKGTMSVWKTAHSSGMLTELYLGTESTVVSLRDWKGFQACIEKYNELHKD